VSIPTNVDVARTKRPPVKRCRKPRVLAAKLDAPSGSLTSSVVAGTASHEKQKPPAALVSSMSSKEMEQLAVVGAFEEDQFADRYQRNNKCSGLKNLRCFPNCGQVHQSRKYCGQPVTFRAVHSKGSKVVAADDDAPSGSSAEKREEQVAPQVVSCSGGKELFAWGRFDLSEDGDKSIQVGTVVEENSIVSQERRRGRPFLPWYPSKIMTRKDQEQEREVVRFEFNSENQGWHYAWQATKYTCNLEHVFKVYVFSRAGPSQLVCCGIFDSPRFTIYCRRRQRFNRPDASNPLPKATLESRLLWYVLSNLEKVHLQDQNCDTESDASGYGSTQDQSTTSLAPVVKIEGPCKPSTSSAAGSKTVESQDHMTKSSVTSANAKAAEPGSLEARIQVALNSFARHIVEETAFTEKIAALSEEVSFRRDRGESIDKGFRLFLRCIRDYVQTYFKQHGISLEDFSTLQGFVDLNIANHSSTKAPLKEPLVKGNEHYEASKESAPELSPSKVLNVDGVNVGSRPEHEVRIRFLDLVDGKSEAAKSFKRPRTADEAISEDCAPSKRSRERAESKAPPKAQAPLKSGDIKHDVTIYAEQFKLRFQQPSPQAAGDNGSPDPFAVWRCLGFDPDASGPNCEGVWSRGQSITKGIDMIREKMSMPGIRRKLLQMMERQIKFIQTPTSIKVYLCAKLMSDGFIEYELDGKERPFNFKDPIVGLSHPMALTKQAFAFGNAFVVRHFYTTLTRMTRIMFRSSGANKLHVLYFFEGRQAPTSDVWEIKEVLHQVADPVKQD